MKRAATILGLLVAIAAAVLGYAFAEARADPVVRQARVSLPGWPAGAAPVRVVLLSDIHVGSPATSRARLARVVAQVNALRPDLVLIAGDIVAGDDPLAAAGSAAELTSLAGLRARLGAVAVLGNHDHWTVPHRIRARLARSGVRVLANEAVRIGPVTVGGLDDAFSGHADLPRLAAAMRRAGAPSLVLTHDPSVAPRLPPGGVVLAGHTHCGQVVLPLVGPLTTYSPKLGRTLYDPRYRCGLVRDAGGRTVVVTAGLGGTLPLRLGAPPDVWLLTFGP